MGTLWMLLLDKGKVIALHMAIVWCNKVQIYYTSELLFIIAVLNPRLVYNNHYDRMHWFMLCTDL